MGFMDVLKSSALKFISDSELYKNLGPVLEEALQKIEGTSAEVLGLEDAFRAKLSDPSYNHLPNAIQKWVTPEQWHKFLFNLKHSIFLVEQGHIQLQPQFKNAAHEFVQRLIHGDKGVPTAGNPMVAGTPAEPESES